MSDSNQQPKQQDDEEGREPLSNKISAGIPARPSMADHDSTLASIAEEVSGGIAKIVIGLTLALSRLIPFSERFWRGVYRAGLVGIWKKSGCDYLGMIQVGGEIKPVPVDWDYDAQRFENRHDDWWKAPTEGEYQYRMANKVPTIWASSTSNHVGSHVQAEVAEALDIGHSLDVYQSAQVRVENATLDATATSNGDAVADGGQVAQFNVTGTNPGPFADRVVPLTSEADADARVVSLEKYYETYPEVVDTEEMKAQEKRGELAQMDDDMESLAFKMLLLAGAIIVGSLAVVMIGPELIGGGGGGGGGGSLIPITLGAMGLI
jgi:hypothetical protein